MTESVSADRGSVSENGSERGTRSDSGGKKSGREREPNEMRRTGNTETVTETKTGRRTRKSQNPGPHSHQGRPPQFPLAHIALWLLHKLLRQELLASLNQPTGVGLGMGIEPFTV